MEVSSKNKYLKVVRTLRKDIVRGVYGPGHRLPTRSAMGEEFGVGVATVQKALDELAEDGFVRARARAGTFVVDHPPHLCNYGLIIPQAAEWSYFYTSLRKAIGELQEDKRRRFREYVTSGDVRNRRVTEELCRDVVGHRLAGLILSGGLDELQGTPVLDDPDMPRVLIQSFADINIPHVLVDINSFMDRAVEYLFSMGRKRIAHLRMDYQWSEAEMFENGLRKRGVEIRPYWIQTIPMGRLFRAAANVVNVVMQLEGDKKPNALIIHDDNLVQHAVAGLMAAGVRVPDDVEVIALCNYPSSIESVLPVKMLGVDTRELIRECVQVLDMQRRGETPPPKTLLPVLFENELDGGRDRHEAPAGY